MDAVESLGIVKGFRKKTLKHRKIVSLVHFYIAIKTIKVSGKLGRSFSCSGLLLKHG